MRASVIERALLEAERVAPSQSQSATGQLVNSSSRKRAACSDWRRGTRILNPLDTLVTMLNAS